MRIEDSESYTEHPYTVSGGVNSCKTAAHVLKVLLHRVGTGRAHWRGALVDLKLSSLPGRVSDVTSSCVSPKFVFLVNSEYSVRTESRFSASCQINGFVDSGET